MQRHGISTTNPTMYNERIEGSMTIARMPPLSCVVSVVVLILTLHGCWISANKGSETRLPEASLDPHTVSRQEPKHTEEQNTLYGGILNDLCLHVRPNYTDIQDVVKFALSYTEEHHSKLLQRDSKGALLKPDISHPRKLKLQYTQDGKTAYVIHEENYASGHLQIQRKKAIVGIDYYITLTWNEVPNSYQHNFIIRKDRKHKLYIHGHSFYRPTQNAFRNTANRDRLSKLTDINHCLPVFVPIVSETEQLVSPSCDRDHMTTEECSVAKENMWKESSQHDIHSNKGTDGKENTSLNQTIKFLTFNIWNFNSVLKHNTKKFYNSRIERLGELISSSSSDIIGYQEVRFDAKERTELGPSQTTHLAKHLPKYQFVYQPAMTFKDMGQEGLALFSKYPIISHDFFTLLRNASDDEDSHQRICLHAEIETPDMGMIHVYVTHLSLSQKAREKSVVEIWKHISRHSGPVVLMGDLNAEPNSPEYKFLIGELELQGIKTSGLVDTWTVFHPEPRPDSPGVYKDEEERDYGLTFSALEEHLRKRIDFIFIKLPENIKLTDVSTLDNERRASMAASDHVGVHASLKHMSSK